MPCPSVALGFAGGRGLPRLPPAVRPQRLQQVCDRGITGRRHRYVHGGKRLIFHVGAGVQILVKRGGDDLGRHLSHRTGLPQRPAEIDPVQRQDDIRLAEKLAGRFGKNVEGRQIVRRMVGRKHRALLEVAHHAGAEPLGEADARLPDFRLARAASEHDHRPLGAREQRRGLIKRALAWPRGLGRHEAGDVGPVRRLVEPGFLQSGIETDIDWSGRRRARRDIGAAHGFHQRLRRRWLVIPLDDRADKGALIARGVDPVDPGAALFSIERAGRAQHDHGYPIAPGIEQAHHAVQQPDIAVQYASHGLAGRLGVAMRDGDRMILVQAKQNARPLIAEMVDEAVMQPAITRARVEADIANAQAAEHLRGNVAAPGDSLVRFSFDPVQLHHSPPC